MDKARILKYPPWTSEKTRLQIKNIRADINELSRELNKLDNDIKIILDTKQIIKKRISKKHLYLNQLINQLQETINKENYHEVK